MPSYEYKCECGAQFEVIKSMKDYDRPEACPNKPCTNQNVQRHYAGKAPSVHFKGGGWYTNTHGGGKNPGNK